MFKENSKLNQIDIADGSTKAGESYRKIVYRYRTENFYGREYPSVTMGMRSKDLRPSVNTPRRRRRWGSWSFLGTRWHSRICCWTRNTCLKHYKKNNIKLQFKILSVSLHSASFVRMIDPRISIRSMTHPSSTVITKSFSSGWEIFVTLLMRKEVHKRVESPTEE